MEPPKAREEKDGEMKLSSTIDHAPPAASVDVMPQFAPQPSRTGDGSVDLRGGTTGSQNRILLLESDSASRQTLEKSLRESGFEVTGSSSCQDGLRLAREVAPEVLVLDERLAGFECGDLLAELKSASSTADIRLILLVQGAAPQRAHALDLGADDVLSRPFEPFELQARVRVQLHLKESEDELREQLRILEQTEQASRTAMMVTEKISREASGLRRALRIGLLTLVMILTVTGDLYYRLSRRVSGDMQRSYAAVAALNHSLANQQELLERAHVLSGQMRVPGAWTAEAQKNELVQRSRQLREGLAQAQENSAGDLLRELAETESRLDRLEDESSLAQTVIRDYSPSVCLIYVNVGFRDTPSGRFLRYEMTSEGQSPRDVGRRPQLTLEGKGREFKIDVLGTGFLVRRDGRILTNHHVVEPWWHNDDLEQFTKEGLQPVIAEMRAYFPGSSQSYPLSLVQISPEADLALVRGPVEALHRKPVVLDGGADATIRGEPIVLMGYATGLDAVLARVDDSTLKDIVSASDGNSRRILDSLAEKNLIRPLITQGHLGDVLADQIVYDAQTAPGGSGGPVFNQQGKVIGVNHAILEGFGGSNFGVPARFAKPLLAR
jgi:S1-C subfamily serine protease/CheY-like chemotaxis protein